MVNYMPACMFRSMILKKMHASFNFKQFSTEKNGASLLASSNTPVRSNSPQFPGCIAHPFVHLAHTSVHISTTTEIQAGRSSSALAPISSSSSTTFHINQSIIRGCRQMQAIMVSSRALIGLLAAASSLAVALSGTYLRTHTHTHTPAAHVHPWSRRRASPAGGLDGERLLCKLTPAMHACMHAYMVA